MPRAGPTVLLAALAALLAAAAPALANPCGGVKPATPNSRGIRLALRPDKEVAYGARHITIASVDISNAAYNGDLQLVRKKIKQACSFKPPLRKLDATTTKLVHRVVDDWAIPASDQTYVLNIKSTQVDDWAACLGNNVPGVYNVVGPTCSPSKTSWHTTFYGLYDPQDKNAAEDMKTKFVDGKMGKFRPFLVQNPANEGKPKGNSSAFIWTKI